MSFSTILSAAIDGLGVELVRVEADVSNGLPVFHSENHSVLLLCRDFFLLCIWDNHHKRHHKQEYVRYTISFSQPFRHPKIGEIKLVGFAFLFHFYYIASFLKEWTGCQAYF